MNDLKYEFIGWCKDGQSDKIWGIIELLAPQVRGTISISGKYLVFWGRRGARYQTKIMKSLCPIRYYWHSTVAKKIEEKIKKKYIKVDKHKLKDIYPNFEKDLQDLTFWSMMTKTDKLSIEEWEEIRRNIF
jgi:hypothetical protein